MRDEKTRKMNALYSKSKPFHTIVRPEGGKKANDTKIESQASQHP
jgi:hypothetical protein